MRLPLLFALLAVALGAAADDHLTMEFIVKPRADVVSAEVMASGAPDARVAAFVAEIAAATSVPLEFRSVTSGRELVVALNRLMHGSFEQPAEEDRAREHRCQSGHGKALGVVQTSVASQDRRPFVCHDSHLVYSGRCSSRA